MRARLERLVGDATRFLLPLQRPSTEKGPELLSDGETKIIRLAQPLFRFAEVDASLLQIRDGLLSGIQSDLQGTLRATWSHHEVEGRHLPDRVEVHNGTGPMGKEIWATLQFEWTSVGGRAVPKRCVHDLRRAGTSPREVLTVRFDDVTLEGGSAADEPLPATTPDIPELREAWDAHYRYPEGGVDLSGRLRVEAPNTSDDWSRQEKVGAAMALRGLTGRPDSSGRVYEAARFEVEGALTDRAKAAIASLLEARYTIWTRQDPAAASSDSCRHSMYVGPRETGHWRRTGARYDSR